MTTCTSHDVDVIAGGVRLTTPEEVLPIVVEALRDEFLRLVSEAVRTAMAQTVARTVHRAECVKCGAPAVLEGRLALRDGRPDVTTTIAVLQ